MPEDPDRADELMALLLAHGADPDAKNDAGQTPAEFFQANGRDELSDRLEARTG